MEHDKIRGWKARLPIGKVTRCHSLIREVHAKCRVTCLELSTGVRGLTTCAARGTRLI